MQMGRVMPCAWRDASSAVPALFQGLMLGLYRPYYCAFHMFVQVFCTARSLSCLKSSMTTCRAGCTAACHCWDHLTCLPHLLAGVEHPRANHPVQGVPGRLAWHGDVTCRGVGFV